MRSLGLYMIQMKKLILLVEDNEMNRDMLSRRLIKRGFEIEIAVNGRDAVGFAEKLLPNLILMDMSLPIMDGYKSFQTLLQNSHGITLP